jgi:hypothetical protein
LSEVEYLRQEFGIEDAVLVRDRGMIGKATIERLREILCMLAYYVEWHLREAWRELMFADADLSAKANPMRWSRKAVS